MPEITTSAAAEVSEAGKFPTYLFAGWRVGKRVCGRTPFDLPLCREIGTILFPRIRAGERPTFGVQRRMSNGQTGT
jgi:hypothetical protein